MSAQSGIGVGEALTKAWSETVSSGAVRVLKISIENESLVPTSSKAPAGNAEEDFTLLEDLVEADVPAYFAYRLDATDSANGHPWLFITYVPEDAKVRDKMVYASTRATVTRQLGDSRFTDTFFATHRSDLTPSGYRAHLASSSASAPLTTREKELADIKAAEGVSASAGGTSGRSSNVWGRANSGAQEHGTDLGLRWSEEAKELRQRWASGEGLTTAQFTIDVPSETVVPSPSNEGQLNFPDLEPSYTFHRVDSGASTEASNVFIYCCPSACPIKSRMIYSSNSLVAAKSVAALGVTLAKRLETSDPQEITDAWIRSELGLDASKPVNDDAKPKFSKPARPGKRR